ncbi:unnamed protein product [Rangifer tarandus platyrhynchus]
MARRVGRQREAHVPCQDDTQKYIPVIAGCQWRCQREMPCVFLDTLLWGTNTMLTSLIRTLGVTGAERGVTYPCLSAAGSGRAEAAHQKLKM